MSDITGKGYGDDHDWQCGATTYRQTYYRCRRCGESFLHNYLLIPGIHEAMARSGRVSEHCSALTQSGDSDA